MYKKCIKWIVSISTTFWLLPLCYKSVHTVYQIAHKLMWINVKGGELILDYNSLIYLCPKRLLLEADVPGHTANKLEARHQSVQVAVSCLMANIDAACCSVMLGPFSDPPRAASTIKIKTKHVLYSRNYFSLLGLYSLKMSRQCLMQSSECDGNKPGTIISCHSKKSIFIHLWFYIVWPIKVNTSSSLLQLS